MSLGKYLMHVFVDTLELAVLAWYYYSMNMSLIALLAVLAIYTPT
jgi:hypothetical protein